MFQLINFIQQESSAVAVWIQEDPISQNKDKTKFQAEILGFSRPEFTIFGHILNQHESYSLKSDSQRLGCQDGAFCRI